MKHLQVSKEIRQKLRGDQELGLQFATSCEVYTTTLAVRIWNTKLPYLWDSFGGLTGCDVTLYPRPKRYYTTSGSVMDLVIVSR